MSMIAVEGQPFHSPESDEALIGGIKQALDPRVEYHELDMDINDERFADAMAERLHELLSEAS
jgi:uncharacterized protein (UPF0261 family)